MAKMEESHELVVANKKINQLEEFLQNNFNELSDYKYALDVSSIIAITDQKGIIKKVNSNFCKISKYSEEELIGQDHRIINSGYHSKEFIRQLWETISNGKIWKGELRNKAKDGTFYWVDTTIVPFLNKQGKPYQYLAIRSDITDRKKIEEDMIKKNEELETFVYISSHDLQEPLRKIQMISNSILETEKQNLSDKGQNYFAKMYKAANRMQTLIRDLLAYSHYKTTIHKFEKTDLKIIIEQVKSELNYAIQEKHATIEASELCPANIIPYLFHQLLHCLISNALKFSQPNIPPHIIIKSRVVKGSELNIEKLSHRKSYCHISVADNGIGFDPQYKDRIFEVFQRLHSKEEYAGTGIGLAIVKKIVENHNGIITATGELKKGTTFNIYIPAN
ncbi:MAG: PAS domain-containing sensor histidine kinase [Chitinophagaceae bacterium]